jgi:hypothetical protein
MIESIHLKNIGPLPDSPVTFSPRLNLITGDNGLGKTLLLDAAWFALTRRWPDNRVTLPNHGMKGDATITCAVRGVTKNAVEVSSQWDRKLQDWRLNKGKPVKPGLVVYARIDGGFSIWDPARNYSRHEPGDGTKALHLNRSQVWDGDSICLGLVLDWEAWRLSDSGAWKLFSEVLIALSPASSHGPATELLIPLPAERLRVDDRAPTPFLKMSYGNVPVTQCSAGMRRVLALAYVLVWTWLRHQDDARLTGQKPATSIVLLWDEIEAHLHPQWQRLILPAVIKVVSGIILRSTKADVQILATSHAPLVLASMETYWAESTDKLINVELNAKGKVLVEHVKWARFGDASGWLVSPAFDMDSGYSREAERAMKAADDLMAGYQSELPDDLREAEAIHTELTRTLDSGDPFWPLWLPWWRKSKHLPHKQFPDRKSP